MSLLQRKVLPRAGRPTRITISFWRSTRFRRGCAGWRGFRLRDTIDKRGVETAPSTCTSIVNKKRHPRCGSPAQKGVSKRWTRRARREPPSLPPRPLQRGNHGR